LFTFLFQKSLEDLSIEKQTLITKYERDIQKLVEKQPVTSFSVLFRRECKLFFILSRMYLYCIDPAKSKNSQQLPNCKMRRSKSF